MPTSGQRRDAKQAEAAKQVADVFDTQFWTPERTAVMRGVIGRTGIHSAVAGLHGATELPRHSRRLVPMYVTVRHMQHADETILTNKNVGTQLQGLYTHGYLRKMRMSQPNAEITAKGWAWAGFTGVIPVEWLNLLYTQTPAGHGDTVVHKDTALPKEAVRLLREMTQRKQLVDLSDPGNLDKLIEETLDTKRDELANLPFRNTEFDLPDIRPGGRNYRDPASPVLTDEHVPDPEVEQAPPQDADAIPYLGDRGAMTLSDMDASAVPVPRVKTPGHPERLGDHVDQTFGDIRGVDKIAMGLDMARLEDAGVTMGLPPQATLGDVDERLRRESVSRMAEDEATALTDENIDAANQAAQDADDALPMVDWIEKQLSQYDYDGMTPTDKAALVARSAVLRAMRQRTERFGFMDPHREIGPEDADFHYTGGALVLRDTKNVFMFEGRPATITMMVDSDYDPDDVEFTRNWFADFVSYGIKGTTGLLVERETTFRSIMMGAPAGSKLRHERVGDVEHTTVTPVHPPVWTVLLSGFIGGAVALAGLMAVLILS